MLSASPGRTRAVTCRSTSAASWVYLSGLETRAPHDIIHRVTSFPWRKVAKASGKGAPMNCGNMINMSLTLAMTHLPPSQWHLNLVRQKGLHGLHQNGW